MANLRDMKKRITSVKSTKQITRTMEMVATAKIRKATDRVVAATPYSEAMLEMLGNLAGKASASHPLLEAHPEKKHALFVVVASDRGLAGAFNTQVLRAADKQAQAYAAQGIETSYILCGKKAIGYFGYRGVTAEMKFAGLSADPTFDEASRIASYVRDKYATGQVDEVLVYYNHTRNAADQVIYQSEKTLNEMGDKVSESDKAPVLAAIEKLKEAQKGTDVAAIKAATDEVQKAFYAVSEKLYKNAAPQGDPNANPGAGAQPNGGNDDGVVDADFEEVNDN